MAERREARVFAENSQYGFSPEIRAAEVRHG